MKGVADFAAMSDLPRDAARPLSAQAGGPPPDVAQRLRLPGREHQAGPPARRRPDDPVGGHARRRPPDALRLDPGRLRVRVRVLPDGDDGARAEPHRRRDRRAGVGGAGDLEPGARLTHVVFMGMGEPLANYAATVKALRILVAPLGFGFSPRRITVSTVGLVQGLERLAREDLRVNLAISLHAATDEVRSRLMPVNRGWGLDDLLAACRRLPAAGPPADDVRVHAARRGQRLAGRRPAARAPAPRPPGQGQPHSVQRVARRELPAAAAPSASSRSSGRSSTPASPPTSAGPRARTSAPPAASSPPDRGQALTSECDEDRRPLAPRIASGRQGLTPVTVAFATLGCKLNQYDTAEVQALLEARGLPDGAVRGRGAGVRHQHLHGDGPGRLLGPPGHPARRRAEPRGGGRGHGLLRPDQPGGGRGDPRGGPGPGHPGPPRPAGPPRPGRGSARARWSR